MSFVKHSLSIALLASASLLIGCATPAPTAPPAAAAPAAPNYPDSVKAYVASVKKQIKTINLEQFRALYDKKAAGLIIDVRQENEFEDGFVPGAVNVPRGLIEFRIWKLAGFPGAVDMNKQMTLYCATGGRCALATKSLQDLGITNVTSVDGRVGVTDLAQLRALEPYYAFMDEMGIISFFEAANELGALSWREKHLDPLIAKSTRGYCTSDKQSLFASLDSEMSNHRKFDRSWFAIDHWFERREEELWKRRELLAIIGEWACVRASEPAVALLCEALLYFGERPDLALLDHLPSTLRVSGFDRIANCVYGVQQRSLSRGYEQT